MATFSISPGLVQHYILEVNPWDWTSVVNGLEKAGLAMAEEQKQKVGNWHLFAWLDRPAIWALRRVEITSGLDTFLLSDGGLSGLTDVAELIGHILISDQRGTGVCSDWQEFAKAFDEPGILYATFMWIDWDALNRVEAWGSNSVPRRSHVLAGIRALLDRSIESAFQNGSLDAKPAMLLTGSMGDADIVLYGYVRSTRDLDYCLYLLSQMGCDVLAKEVYTPSRKHSGSAWPVFYSTHTELAIDCRQFLNMLKATQTNSPLSKETVHWVNNSFTGEVFPEVGFIRGHSPVPTLKDQLTRIAGKGWSDRSVLGREDFVLEPTSARTFFETVALLAHLDVACCEVPGFPRRSSIRLGFVNPLGKTKHPPTRHELFSLSEAASSLELSPNYQNNERLSEEQIGNLYKIIVDLRTVGWREDLRILERMAERCITLQKSRTLGRESRRLLFAAFERLSAICARILLLEQTPLDRPPQDGQPPAPPQMFEEVTREIRLARDELFRSGTGLDRVLSHHSKGVVSLLLHPASQARGPDHIGSEVGLSLGLGVLFRSPVLQLREHIRSDADMSADATEWLRQLTDKLQEVATPIIYASHDPDFNIRPPLSLLRVPRWALWYPLAASHLMHELGHAFAVVGSLGFLLNTVLERLHSWRPCSCECLEQSLRDLGLPAEAWKIGREPVALDDFAKKFFNDDQAGINSRSHFTDRTNPLVMDEMEEIAADVVARLFCYRDGDEGDRRHLWDCFDYIAPFTSRSEPQVNLTRLLRLLAAHVTVAHLRQIRRRHLLPLEQGGYKEAWMITERAVEGFRVYLQTWADDFFRQHEHFPLSNVLSQTTLKHLPEEFRQVSDELLQTYETSALLLAVVFSIKPLKRSHNQSLFKSTHIWGNVVSAAWSRADKTASEQEVIEALAQGRVPELRHPYPELLPRSLAWHFEKTSLHNVPAYVRLALSCYLCDLYLENNDF